MRFPNFLKNPLPFLLPTLAVLAVYGVASAACLPPERAWVSRYNGPGNTADSAFAVAVDGDGSVYVTGYSNGSGTGSDYATVKYDASGTQQWVARYNGPGNTSDLALALALDGNGNVYVTGASWGSGNSHDYATVKYNASGAEQWVARYNGLGNNWDVARSLALDGNGNVYVAGESDGSGTGFDLVTVKYNTSGVEQWVRRYNGPGNSSDVARAMAVDEEGSVYVTGASGGSDATSDYATVKYDATGVEQWVARYNGSGNSGDGAQALATDGEGNIYITGGSYGSGTGEDYATVKYDASGVEQWVRRYNGPGNSHEDARALAVDAEGSVYVSGRSRGTGTDYDYATLKYDSVGNLVWSNRYNGTGNSHDIARALAVDWEGNVYVAGDSDGSGTSADYTTIKYAIPYPPVQFSAATPSADEDSGGVTITVTRTGNTTCPASVNYATGTSGTATAGTDFTAASGTLSFAANETEESFTVSLTPDNLLEEDETVTLSLGNPDEAVLGSQSTAVLTITDDRTTPAPSALAAQVLSSTRVRHSWSDNCANEGDFLLERSTDGGSTWPTALPASNNASESGPVTFTDENLTPGTEYTYRVRARKDALLTDPSGEIRATPRLRAPASLSATAAITPLRVEVEWTDDSGVGSSSFSNEDDATTAAAPAAPTALTATPVTGALKVDVAWTDNSNDESYFYLYRKIGSGTWTYYARMPSGQRTFRDVGVSGGTTYSYKVRAYKNGVSYSFYSNEDDATLPRISATPTGLTATRGGNPRRVDLAWNDNSDDELNFIIYRKVGGGAFTYYTRVGANVRTFRDTGVVAGTNYTYQVRAWNGSFYSAYSNLAGATPQ